ncbi:hypothetical protein [Martelella sp. AD-3]|uniref:lipopolysaccharide biosynthesis protein n=1 Tax=Martelella sp. AD-3 TaxID=686597 RepID=UPI0004AE2303|nr:hypothetical protein [Martelella sp. AD-3]
MIEATVEKVRRNFLRSSFIIVLSFLVTATTNILLISWLTKNGGFKLVGIWGLLSAVVMYITILDFGFINALTRKMAIDGPLATIPTIRWLISRFLTVVTPVLLLLYLLSFVMHQHSDKLIGFAFASCAGAIQVLGGWLISLRLGSHEQFWFNATVIARVLVQAIVIIFFFHSYFDNPFAFLGFSFFAGSFVEILIDLVLSYKFLSDWIESKSSKTNFSDVRSMSKGFGVAHILQKAQEPTWRMLSASFGGTAALGVFTVAIRIPSVINSSIGQAQRALLPGLGQLQTSNDISGIRNLIRDGILVQMVIVVPGFIVLLSLSQLFLDVWLGESATNELLYSTRLMAIAFLIQCPVIPFFWALQALGDARKIAYTTAATLSFVCIFGAAALKIGDVLICAEN